MTTQLGQIQTKLKEYLSKRLYITEWDVDSPSAQNYKSNIDGRVYPSNLIIIVPPDSITTAYTYFGTECKADLNIVVRFRFRIGQYKLEVSLPKASLLNLYSYISSLIPRDKYAISDDIIEIKVKDNTNTNNNPIQIEKDNSAKEGQKDWIVTLNYCFEFRFVAYPGSDIYSEQLEAEDSVDTSEVMPSPANQIGSPKSTTDPTIRQPWDVDQIKLELDLSREADFDPKSEVAEIVIDIPEE